MHRHTSLIAALLLSFASLPAADPVRETLHEWLGTGDFNKQRPDRLGRRRQGHRGLPRGLWRGRRLSQLGRPAL